MNGIYWGLTALSLMGNQDALPKDEMIEWVMSCWVPSVGACHPQEDNGIQPDGAWWVQVDLHRIQVMNLISIQP